MVTQGPQVWPGPETEQECGRDDRMEANNYKKTSHPSILRCLSRLLLSQHMHNGGINILVKGLEAIVETCDFYFLLAHFALLGVIFSLSF